jgi:uncharacterized membrane protein
MAPFQYWFEQTVSQVTPVRLFMQTSWGWPATESVHFIGLTLLFGSIAVWDLRLLGLGRGVPISAFHRLVPYAVAGFTINVVTGSMFVMAEANQYVYNRAFQFKLLFLALAGLNVLIFYVTMFRRVATSGAGAAPPLLAKLNGALSLAFWMAVIICGRLITFYRPTRCRPGETIAFVANCIIR